MEPTVYVKLASQHYTFNPPDKDTNNTY